MTARLIIGILLLTLVFGIFFYGTVLAGGLIMAIVVWGLIIALTFLAVMGIYLIIER